MGGNEEGWLAGEGEAREEVSFARKRKILKSPFTEQQPEVQSTLFSFLFYYFSSLIIATFV